MTTLLKEAVSTAGLTLFSEFGDKTFFVAAILASKFDPFLVYISCWSALATMTVVSGLIGLVIPLLPFFRIDISRFIAAFLLSVFGVQMISEGLASERVGLDANSSEEEKEAAKQIEETNFGSSSWKEVKVFQKTAKYLSGLFKADISVEKIVFFIEVFVMNFIAEWGDKSQFTTVALSSSAISSLGVLIGGVLGHAICTGIAVAFGKAVSEQIPQQRLQVVGGSAFILFAVHLILF